MKIIYGFYNLNDIMSTEIRKIDKIEPTCNLQLYTKLCFFVPIYALNMRISMYEYICMYVPYIYVYMYVCSIYEYFKYIALIVLPFRTIQNLVRFQTRRFIVGGFLSSSVR